MDQRVAEIRARMLERYAAARSYRDTGETSTVHVKGAGATRQVAHRFRFKTAFVLPHSWFFDCVEDGVNSAGASERTVGWRRGGDFEAHWWIWRSSRRPGRPGPHYTGSSYTAMVAGSRLAEKMFDVGQLEPELPEPEFSTLVGDDGFDGARCWIVESKLPRERRFWIDRESHLLRRLDSAKWVSQDPGVLREALDRVAIDDPVYAVLQREVVKRELDPPPAFRSERTTTWRPEIDVAIDASVFDFTPPPTDA